MQTLTWQNQLGLQMRHDRITYNDCFYRNIHMYEYVAVLDVDEVTTMLLDADCSKNMVCDFFAVIHAGDGASEAQHLD